MSNVDDKIKSYPVTFDIDYPEKQSRLKALFRIILVIPVYFLMLTFSNHLDVSKVLQYYMVKYNKLDAKAMATPQMQALHTQVIAEAPLHHPHLHAFAHGMTETSVYIILPVFLMILFRRKYPQWLFAFNTGALAFTQRVVAYLYCLTPNYPSIDEDQGVHLNISFPEENTLHRYLPFIKWLLLLPHYVCLIVLGIACLVVAVLGWICVVFTGKYPRSLFNFFEGYLRWAIRVGCYGFLLITDEYPPFSLK